MTATAVGLPGVPKRHPVNGARCALPPQRSGSNPEPGPMRKTLALVTGSSALRIVAVVALVALPLGFALPASSAVASSGSPPTVTTGTGASCVGAWFGGDGAISFTHSSTGRTLHLKCYHSAAMPSSVTSWIDSTTTTAPSGKYFSFPRGSGVHGSAAPSCGADPYCYTEYALIAADDAADYFEISVKIKQVQGTLSVQDGTLTTNNFGFLTSTTVGPGASTNTSLFGTMWVTQSAYESTYPSYRWGPLYNTSSSWCDGLTVLTEFGVSSGQVVQNGDVVLVDVGDVYDPAGPMPTGARLWYRWEPSEDFKPFSLSGDEPWDEVPFTNSTGPHSIGTFEVKCTDDMSEGGETFFYSFVGVQSDEAAERRACADVTIDWPVRARFPLEADEDYRFIVNVGDIPTFSSGVTGLSVVYVKGTTPTTTEIEDITTLVGTSASYPIGANTSRAFVFTPTESVEADEIRVVCEDGTGSKSLLYGNGASGLSAIPVEDQEGYLERLNVCFDAIPGMSLTSPSSWVRGILGGLVCIAELIFVPNDGFFSELFDDESEAVFDEDSVFYPVTAAGTLFTSAADLLVVSDAEVNAGSCAFALPWQKINATGSGTSGSAVTVFGLSGEDIGFNTCADADSQTIVKAARYLGLVVSVFGFVIWAFRYVQLLRGGVAAYHLENAEAAGKAV